MTADKRSVHTDALETLGTIIDETAARDAIHLAVEPVVAGERLFNGQDVCLIDGKAYSFRAKQKMLGIVDPFIRVAVEPGERFWLVVYPRQITSLRHVWAHPDFPEGESAATDACMTSEDASKAWLRTYAERVGIPYDTLMDGAEEWVSYEEYLCLGGLLEGEYVPDEFWGHYQTVTGKQVDESRQRSFFTCAC